MKNLIDSLKDPLDEGIEPPRFMGEAYQKELQQLEDEIIPLMESAIKRQRQ